MVKFQRNAPIAQWIERWPPEPKTAVRVCLGVLVLIWLAAGCSAGFSPQPGWQAGDLRLLDAADSPTPSQDLIAVYARLQGSDLQLRLDLLDALEIPDYDLYLAFDLAPGGTDHLPLQVEASLAWDLLLRIPASGAIQVLAPDPASDTWQTDHSLVVRVLRNPQQDYLKLSLKQSEPNALFSPAFAFQAAQLQVFLAPPASRQVSDQIGPLRLNAPATSTAPTLLAFWNSLPAYTPLQALRRWDGAHSGPLGGRHGLNGVLRAVERTRSPVFLLDLNQPASLSALQPLEALERVRQLEQTRLLFMPQVIPGLPSYPGVNQPAWVLEEFMRQDSAIAAAFGFSTSETYYFPDGINTLSALSESQYLPDTAVVFVPGMASLNIMNGLPYQAQILRQAGRLLVILPGFNAAPLDHQQATSEGLAMETRRELLQAAIQAQASPFNPPITVLGGDLSLSAWGNPQVGRASLAYIQEHPWINLLDMDELLTLNLATEQLNLSKPSPILESQPAWINVLWQAPENQLTTAAWQAYRALGYNVSPSPAQLNQLRQHYANQVTALISAAAWAAQPGTLVDCASDPDQDQQTECILASETVFAVIEKDLGGYLGFLFVRDQRGGLHQLVAPSALLINGLSPGDSWDFMRGILADPAVFPGAFWETNATPGTQAQVSISPGQLSLYNAELGTRKIFRLLDDGVQISLEGSSTEQALSMSVVINFDPWQRFQPTWENYYRTGDSDHDWWIGNPGTQFAKLSSDSEFTAQAATENLQLLRAPENPDRDFPSGYPLPFPLASIQLTGTGDINATLRLHEPTTLNP